MFDYHDDNAQEYEAEQIVNEKIINAKIFYQVKWKNFPRSQNTWEPEEHLINVPDLIQYWNQQKRKILLINKPKQKKVDHLSQDFECKPLSAKRLLDNHEVIIKPKKKLGRPKKTAKEANKNVQDPNNNQEGSVNQNWSNSFVSLESLPNSLQQIKIHKSFQIKKYNFSQDNNKGSPSKQKFAKKLANDYDKDKLNKVINKDEPVAYGPFNKQAKQGSFLIKIRRQDLQTMREMQINKKHKRKISNNKQLNYEYKPLQNLLRSLQSEKIVQHEVQSQKRGQEQLELSHMYKMIDQEINSKNVHKITRTRIKSKDKKKQSKLNQKNSIKKGARKKIKPNEVRLQNDYQDESLSLQLVKRKPEHLIDFTLFQHNNKNEKHFAQHSKTKQNQIFDHQESNLSFMTPERSPFSDNLNLGEQFMTGSAISKYFQKMDKPERDQDLLQKMVIQISSSDNANSNQKSVLTKSSQVIQIQNPKTFQRRFKQKKQEQKVKNNPNKSQINCTVFTKKKYIGFSNLYSIQIGAGSCSSSVQFKGSTSSQTKNDQSLQKVDNKSQKKDGEQKVVDAVPVMRRRKKKYICKIKNVKKHFPTLSLQSQKQQNNQQNQTISFQAMEQQKQYKSQIIQKNPFKNSSVSSNNMLTRSNLYRSRATMNQDISPDFSSDQSDFEHIHHSNKPFSINDSISTIGNAQSQFIANEESISDIYFPNVCQPNRIKADDLQYVRLQKQKLSIKQIPHSFYMSNYSPDLIARRNQTTTNLYMYRKYYRPKYNKYFRNKVKDANDQQIKYVDYEMINIHQNQIFLAKQHVLDDSHLTQSNSLNQVTQDSFQNQLLQNSFFLDDLQQLKQQKSNLSLNTLQQTSSTQVFSSNSPQIQTHSFDAFDKKQKFPQKQKIKLIDPRNRRKFSSLLEDQKIQKRIKQIQNFLSNQFEPWWKKDPKKHLSQIRKEAVNQVKFQHDRQKLVIHQTALKNQPTMHVIDEGEQVYEQNYQELEKDLTIFLQSNISDVLTKEEHYKISEIVQKIKIKVYDDNDIQNQVSKILLNHVYQSNCEPDTIRSINKKVSNKLKNYSYSKKISNDKNDIEIIHKVNDQINQYTSPADKDLGLIANTNHDQIFNLTPNNHIEEPQFSESCSSSNYSYPIKSSSRESKQVEGPSQDKGNTLQNNCTTLQNRGGKLQDKCNLLQNKFNPFCFMQKSNRKLKVNQKLSQILQISQKVDNSQNSLQAVEEYPTNSSQSKIEQISSYQILEIGPLLVKKQQIEEQIQAYQRVEKPLIKQVNLEFNLPVHKQTVQQQLEQKNIEIESNVKTERNMEIQGNVEADRNMEIQGNVEADRNMEIESNLQTDRNIEQAILSEQKQKLNENEQQEHKAERPFGKQLQNKPNYRVVKTVSATNIVFVESQFEYKGEKCFKVILDNNERANARYQQLKMMCSQLLVQFYQREMRKLKRKR